MTRYHMHLVSFLFTTVGVWLKQPQKSLVVEKLDEQLRISWKSSQKTEM